MTLAKIFFIIATIGVALNTLAAMVLENLVLWVAGIVIFLVGAVGVLAACRKNPDAAGPANQQD